MFPHILLESLTQGKSLKNLLTLELSIDKHAHLGQFKQKDGVKVRLISFRFMELR